MLLWKIRGQKDQKSRCGWIVAWSHGDAHDIARHENAELVGEPIEWLPGHGSQVFWTIPSSSSNTVHWSKRNL